MTEETLFQETITRDESEVLEQTMLFALCFFLGKPWQVLLTKRPTLAILEKDSEQPWWHVMVDARPDIPHHYTFKVFLDKQGEFLFLPKGYWLEGLNQVQEHSHPKDGTEGKEKRQAQ